MQTLNFLNSPLITHNFSNEEKEHISTYFTFEKHPKKATLLHGGKICKNLYFVNKGCLHLYFIDQNGTQRTTQFALENWWLTDFLNFPLQTTTEFYIDTVERSEVLRITTDQYNQLLSDHPQLEPYFRKTFEIGYGAALQRIKYMQSYTKEEMYLYFAEAFPHFVNRVPQYLLASFLGSTPEYLSELKKKNIS